MRTIVGLPADGDKSRNAQLFPHALRRDNWRVLRIEVVREPRQRPALGTVMRQTWALWDVSECATASSVQSWRTQKMTTEKTPLRSHVCAAHKRASPCVTQSPSDGSPGWRSVIGTTSAAAVHFPCRVSVGRNGSRVSPPHDPTTSAVPSCLTRQTTRRQ